MILRHALLAAVITGIAATASAQTPSTAPGQPPARTVTKDMPGPAAADARKLIGRSVKNPNNDTIGKIESVYLDANGKVDSVIVGVGGFLGVGEHLVAVPFDKVKFVSEPIAYTSASGSADTGSRRPAGAAPSTTTTGAANTTPPAVKANPWYPDHALYNATKDELKAMPEFKYSN
jgi:sporulation protein YlmC with PRC-barrel domain